MPEIFGDVQESTEITGSIEESSVVVVGQMVLGARGEKGDPATNLVQSVNGKQGVVVLNASDVGADHTGSASQALQDAKDYTDTGLYTKVDKVAGKGLSTNDYTTTDKNKLAGIQAGAPHNHRIS